MNGKFCDSDCGEASNTKKNGQPKDDTGAYTEEDGDWGFCELCKRTFSIAIPYTIFYKYYILGSN